MTFTLEELGNVLACNGPDCRTIVACEEASYCRSCSKYMCAVCWKGHGNATVLDVRRRMEINRQCGKTVSITITRMKADRGAV